MTIWGKGTPGSAKAGATQKGLCSRNRVKGRAVGDEVRAETGQLGGQERVDRVGLPGRLYGLWLLL